MSSETYDPDLFPRPEGVPDDAPMDPDLFPIPENDADVVDLFAGPGGWDVAAHRLGLTPVGIEFDKHACATRRAAGFLTIEDDVRKHGPHEFPNARGLIASPPCQTFSMAGKGAGRKALDDVLRLLDGMAVGILPDYTTLSDDRTGLVLDPLRWVLEAIALDRPFEWLAFEQVPTVLPVWQRMAEVLRGCGYKVETAVLNAEQYGVPQTRRRAILVARLHGGVQLPTPTHSRYYSRDRTRLDPGVLPWVSMAQALGWSEQTVVVSNYGSGGDAANRGERSAAEPSATVTSKVDRNVVLGAMATGTRSGAAVRSVDEPSPTLAFGHDAASYVWVPEGMTPAEVVAWKAAHLPVLRHNAGERDRPRNPETGKQIVREADGTDYYLRFDTERPAPAVTGMASAWAWERPATTVVGSFAPDIIAAPGYRTTVSRQNAEGSVRVSIEEAAILQSLPNHPWQGTKGQKHQQIGNMIPPLLAEAVLRQIL